MIKFIKITLLILLLVMSNLEAQVVSSGFGESAIDQQVSHSLISGKGYDQIKGSPYYVSKFGGADIHFSNGKVYKNIYTRFNLYENELEFRKDGKWYKLIFVNQIDKIILDGQEFIIIENPAQLADNGFYMVELNGKHKVLRQMSVMFREAKLSSNSYSQDQEAEFIREKDKYYLFLDEQKLLSFKNRKSFEKIFSKQNPDLLSFVKREKLNPSKIDDLKKIAVFLNEKG